MAKRHHNMFEKITPGRETQTQGGRGVVTGIFWEDKIYPPLPKTNDLTFAEKDRAKQGLTSVQYTRESVIRPTPRLEMAKNKNTAQPALGGTEETIGASYGVTLTYRTNENNTATIASHNRWVDTIKRKHEWLHTIMNAENRNMQRIMSEGSKQTNNKMKEQIKKILMSGKAKVVKLSKSD